MQLAKRQEPGMGQHRNSRANRFTGDTVMITPDRFSTIRRAARRAVRKYDLA
jgi:hypothetical protein